MWQIGGKQDRKQNGGNPVSKPLALVRETKTGRRLRHSAAGQRAARVCSERVKPRCKTRQFPGYGIFVQYALGDRPVQLGLGQAKG